MFVELTPSKKKITPLEQNSMVSQNCNIQPSLLHRIDVYQTWLAAPIRPKLITAILPGYGHIADFKYRKGYK
jgi:hypothetical protein